MRQVVASTIIILWNLVQKRERPGNGRSAAQKEGRTETKYRRIYVPSTYSGVQRIAMG